MMQFHDHGYVSTDPRVRPADGTGIDRPAQLPDEVDVLIIGSGPAGMLLAAQMAQFPSISTRIVERRPGRLKIGQADGIQARSVETFQAFGFAEEIIHEAYQITAMNFWNPDPQNHDHIVRTSRTVDDPEHLSEFPHLIVNQARVLDYFAAVAARSAGRIVPDYGMELIDLTVGSGEYPVTAVFHETTGENMAGDERTIRAKYVIGCDGARSVVRKSIGRELVGDQQMQAWGVMDVLAVTDFPDIRTKCAIQSKHGSILHIPREGGYLFRMYVDLGHVTPDNKGTVRQTTLEETVKRANQILSPYTLDVKDVAWYTVYEVGHRLTDKFDDCATDDADPRVFIAGDACHTHSAKAGQGMNVSMQDTFNLGWKLGQVLEGRSPASLLHTYSGERHTIAQNLIDFDREWSALMAKDPDEFESPEALADFYIKTWEFPSGFMTQYPPSPIIGEATYQELAKGYPLGKRFRSAHVTRVADVNHMELGHHARADGRWRLYAFADADHSALDEWASWLLESPESPVVRYTPAGRDLDAVFDVKVIYQQEHSMIELPTVPPVFFPTGGPFRLVDYEKVYAANPEDDIFTARGIDRGGCVVVVRPDQYVAHVLPLSATSELAAFFAQSMLDQ